MQVLIAAGTGLAFQNAYAIAECKAQEKDKANAIGFINVGQIGTLAIALAIAACVYENLGRRSLHNALQGFNLPHGFIEAALAGVASSSVGDVPPEVDTIVLNTVAFTISRVFALGVGFSALMLISSLLMRQEKLNLQPATTVQD